MIIFSCFFCTCAQLSFVHFIVSLKCWPHSLSFWPLSELLLFFPFFLFIYQQIENTILHSLSFKHFILCLHFSFLFPVFFFLVLSFFLSILTLLLFSWQFVYGIIFFFFASFLVDASHYVFFFVPIYFSVTLLLWSKAAISVDSISTEMVFFFFTFFLLNAAVVSVSAAVWVFIYR